MKPEDFYNRHKNIWKEIVKKEGLVDREETGWWFLQAILTNGADRQYDLSSAKSIGFTETIDTVKSYTDVFDTMKKAKFIP
jgi:hypothetical protein